MATSTIPPEPAETPLVYLRAIRGILDDHTRKFDEVIERLGRVEREVANLHRDVADLHSDFASLSTRLDRLDGRVARDRAPPRVSSRIPPRRPGHREMASVYINCTGTKAFAASRL